MFSGHTRLDDVAAAAAWTVLAVVAAAALWAAVRPWAFGARRRDVAALLPVVVAVVLSRVALRACGHGVVGRGWRWLWGDLEDPYRGIPWLAWLAAVAVPLLLLAVAWCTARRPVLEPFWWERCVARLAARFRPPPARPAWLFDDAEWRAPPPAVDRSTP